MFEERHSLCSKTMKRPIFGRTDLRKGVSEAKFDVEADFEVKKSLAPPKSAENHEKPKKIEKKNFRRFFFSIRKRLKRVLATFCRSKTAKNGENAF